MSARFLPFFLCPGTMHWRKIWAKLIHLFQCPEESSSLKPISYVMQRPPMGTQASSVKMLRRLHTLNILVYKSGVMHPPLRSPDVSSHFIKGGTLIGGLGQQGNKCQSHTDQDFILLQRWVGILIRTCESLRQGNAWPATQHWQICIFMNNNIVSIAACVGDRCLQTTSAFCLMAKRKYSASCRLIIARQQLKTSKTLKTIYLGKKGEKVGKSHRSSIIFPQASHEYSLFASENMLYEAWSSQQLVCILLSYHTWPWTQHTRSQILSRRFETELDNRGSAGGNCQIG